MTINQANEPEHKKYERPHLCPFDQEFYSTLCCINTYMNMCSIADCYILSSTACSPVVFDLQLSKTIFIYVTLLFNWNNGCDRKLREKSDQLILREREFFSTCIFCLNHLNKNSWKGIHSLQFYACEFCSYNWIVWLDWWCECLCLVNSKRAHINYCKNVLSSFLFWS